MAAARVFDIAELFEIVLCYVPAVDLIVAQRTNQHFEATIRASPRRQQMLFLPSPLDCRLQRRWNHMIFRQEDQLPDCEEVTESEQEANHKAEPESSLNYGKDQHFYLNVNFESDKTFKQYSYRKMFVTQPLVTQLEISWDYAEGEGRTQNENVGIKIRNDFGVTYGEVLHKVMLRYNACCTEFDNATWVELFVNMSFEE
ncbi:hypothetical protein LTR37_001466 [Vermiconidia calcicola]|uniref:Uncharacterized protein n=1 Tax=Vermiconidia calcicola TaxID=1690605 RepID=A0ACC3NW67_9PEZI|nr:hypothetical protein LTR37_001466 [Vermiconidia calcicola]